jgi:signal transduction histidine kinase
MSKTDSCIQQHPSHHIHDYSQIVVGSTEEEDATELFQAIKDVRSIIFLPIWDHEKDRWFGTILGWTTDRTRILETDDLNYLSAFGNSMMAEVSRLKATGLSQAKSDFISSISHELRSPLHGILAGTELLRESALSTRELSLLGTIDACGNMLLDTLENLLDYAK